MSVGEMGPVILMFFWIGKDSVWVDDVEMEGDLLSELSELSDHADLHRGSKGGFLCLLYFRSYTYILISV